MRNGDNNLIERGMPCSYCNSTDAKAEYTNNYYCFSCKHSTQKSVKKSKWRAVVAAHLTKGDKIRLPVDFTTKLTSQEKSFLYSYHFTDALIEKYRIGHSDFSNYTGERLILPHYLDNKLKYYEGKYLGSDHKISKYITIGTKKELFKTFSGYAAGVVIVEDILSAMRIGEVYPAIALRGTKLSDDQLLDLAKTTTNFLVWLDNDLPGRQASDNIAAKLAWTGYVNIIHSDKDPKYYSDTKIKEFINKVKRP